MYSNGQRIASLGAHRSCRGSPPPAPGSRRAIRCIGFRPSDSESRTIHWEARVRVALEFEAAVPRATAGV